ncbi:DUF6894 family protein [Ensifer canadensis]|uniref:DUF6894 family protein n=1 Tax=Ensifer canadensis TaxID=555315 RepID=UPI00193F61C0|nr:hypothetical protein [Ensifer canadensis]UBI79883.1 hypothetical protein J3R84_30010 [Ensifer canadensis]
MPLFYFRTTDQEGFSADDRGFEFPDEKAALAEAKVTLAEMAADGLPLDPVSMISVQVMNEDRILLLEMRLVLEIIPNTNWSDTGNDRLSDLLESRQGRGT